MLDYWRQFRNLSREPRSVIVSKLVKKNRLFWARRYLNALCLLGFSSGISAPRLLLLLLPSARKNYSKGLPVLWPLWPIEQKSQLIKIIKEDFPQHADAVVAQAKEYLVGRYRLLEPHVRDLKTLSLNLAAENKHEPTYLPWHYDWVKPYRWDPKKNYLDCEYESFDGIDVKFPWELSRMSHLVTLAQAYCLTENESFADEVVIQISDWWKHNPPGYGVNWACSMDAGMRAANVLMALGLLGDEFLKSRELLARFLPAFFYHHAAHIVKNLELPTNHLLGDLTGLGFVAKCYPYFHASLSWERFVHRGFIDQMKKQILDDGMDFEGSTSYHRLVNEFFLAHRLLFSAEGFPGSHHERLRLMFDAVDYFVKPDGVAVQIGDNDSGRLWALAPERPLMDFRYLSGLGYLALEPKKPDHISGYPPEALWLLGPQSYSSWRQQNAAKSTVAQRGVKFGNLPQAGIYFWRDQERGHYLAVRSQSLGVAHSQGHFHNDLLSFHLMFQREDIFIDPGTGVYLRNRQQRDELRSTRLHNTLMIADQEQRIFDGPFALRPSHDQLKVNRWGFDETLGSWFFSAEKNCAIDGVLKIKHDREICLEQAREGIPRFVLTDRVAWGSESRSSNQGSIALQWNFVLSPDISIFHAGGGEVLMKTLKGRRYSFKGSIPIEVVDGLYSPEFGVIVRTKRLKAGFDAKLPVKLEFVFEELP